jgi:hypothetical protein
MKLVQAQNQYYPDTSLLLYMMLGTLAGFIVSLVCKIVSLAIIATPSMLCSVIIILSIKAVTPVHPTSIIRQALLCIVLTPLARVNFVVSLFPVISIAFSIAYRDIQTTSVDIQSFEYIDRYSLISYIVIMFFASGAAALSALSCILCHAARPSVDLDTNAEELIAK